MHLSNTVIFISNPFGFGPTGKTVALMEELRSKWKGRIVYGASPMCQETIPEHLRKDIIVEPINERAADSLKKIFNKYPQPFVVCTLNKLAINTAKNLGLPAFFIDSLGWLWKEIPAEYLLADTYYCFNIFGMKNKVPPRENIKLIAPIFGTLPTYRTSKEPYLLVHIGGFKNPFEDKMSFAYLDLILESLHRNKSAKEIIVTGGSEAIWFMKTSCHKKDIHFLTLSRNNFLKYLNSASRFVTTSGLTATLEAFALRTPTVFLPPTNLSQWKILKLLASQGCAESKFEWDDLLGHPTNFDNLTEQEAVPEFHSLAQQVYNNPALRSTFVKKFNEITSSTVSRSGQTNFILQSGTNGSTIIVEDLLLHLT